MPDLNKFPLLTWLLFVVAIIVVVVGGIEVIRGVINYQDWVKYLIAIAGAGGLNGIGKGLFKMGENKQPAVQVDNVEKVTTTT